MSSDPEPPPPTDGPDAGGAEELAIDLRVLDPCFQGAVPAVIATASAEGVPNITYLSRVLLVDAQRIALSNQFFSKTVRNLAENPRASVLLIDPLTYDEYRLSVVYERTERRGEVFDKLHAEVEALAALQGMQGVFHLRAADVYRVVRLEHLHPHQHARTARAGRAAAATASRSTGPTHLAQLTTRLSRSPDLDTLVGTTVDGLADLLGYDHSVLFLLDESGRKLFTIASHGYADEGVGSEVAIGEGIAGVAAARCEPVRVANLRQMEKYAFAVRQGYEDPPIGPGWAIPVPVLASVQSRVAVPAMAFGQLVGVLMVESDDVVAYDESDEAVLSVVASVVANAVETDRAQCRTEEPGPTVDPTAAAATEPGAPDGADAEETPTTLVRFFAVDGSTFLDGDYLIKGVAGRILWSLLGHHERDGRVEFTNREVRLDPTLELPEIRDNLESRLILLKRRLDERDAPIRIHKTGRGCFRLEVQHTLELDAAGT
jgi:predicted pyridoxine 5'-phosphate oxidase superfamily flavin-nucleotide-binding protein